MIRWYDVLAAAYKGGRADLKNLRAHAVYVESQRVVCGTIGRDKLADVVGDFTPLCPKCQSRIRRFEKECAAKWLSAPTPEALARHEAHKLAILFGIDDSTDIRRGALQINPAEEA